MPDTVLETLHLANRNLRQGLARLQGDGSNSVKYGALADLRDYVSQAATCLGRIRPAGSVSSQVQAEVSQYRSYLQTLARVLPDCHARMLAERARLQTAGKRQQAVEAWANAQQTRS